LLTRLEKAVNFNLRGAIMQKHLKTVKDLLEKSFDVKVDYSSAEANIGNNKYTHEVLKVMHNPDPLPFMTITYDASTESLKISTELQYPDTFLITEIVIACMNVCKVEAGRAYLIVPSEEGAYDILYSEEAYDFLDKAIQEDKDFMDAQIEAMQEADDQDLTGGATMENSLIFPKKPTGTNGNNNLH
jgi:hypothetical protein